MKATLIASEPGSLAIENAGVIPYERRLASSIDYVLDEGGRLFMGASEVNRTLKRISAKLDELGVSHAVAGGMAMIAHGYVRFTDDVDILITRADLTQVHEAVDERGWIRPFSTSKNLRDATTGVKIKFLLTGDFPGDGKPKPVSFPQPANVAIEINGIKYLNVATLINLKLASFMTGTDRAKDLGDVQELMKALRLGEEFAASVDPYVRSLYEETCERLATTSRPFVRIWQGALPSGLPSGGPKLVEAIEAIDPSLAPLFADGVGAELVPGKRQTHVKLFTQDRRIADKYQMVDESEVLLD